MFEGPELRGSLYSFRYNADLSGLEKNCVEPGGRGRTIVHSIPSIVLEAA